MSEPNTPQRQPRFQRNANLEELLRELNSRLQHGEADLAERWAAPQWPVVLVIGAPRSGTTLAMQWLADTGCLAYPTNLLSRFFGAPYIGSLVQQLITDPRYQFGDELSWGIAEGAKYRSDLGKTSGLLQPNEFWYFWRRFFPTDQAQYLDGDALGRVDVPGFLAGLASLQAAHEKPWAMKGILLQYNLAFLAEILPQVLFVFTERSPLDNAMSLYQARIKYFGDADAWFSVRPPGYERLQSMDAFHQVAGQVLWTNRSIERELETLPPQAQLRLPYEDFCRRPADYYEALASRLREQGWPSIPEYRGPASFAAQTRSSDGGDHYASLEQACQELEKNGQGGSR